MKDYRRKTKLELHEESEGWREAFLHARDDCEAEEAKLDQVRRLVEAYKDNTDGAAWLAAFKCAGLA